MRSRVGDRPHGDVDGKALGSAPPCCPRPTHPFTKGPRAVSFVAFIRGEASPTHRRHERSRRCRPASTDQCACALTTIDSCRRPFRFKTLQPLSVANIGRNDASRAGRSDRRRRRNTNRRPPFERRHAVHSPSQPADALGPVKPAARPTGITRVGLAIIPVQQNLPWVVGRRCEQDDSQPALRQAECTSIDDAVCPRIAELPEPLGELRHGPAAIE